jgi:hypothetical protein
MLVSNARVIKLWSLKEQRQLKSDKAQRAYTRSNRLVVPKPGFVTESENISDESLKHVSTFKSGMEIHLHSISLSTDQENFIAADHNSINLWNLERRNPQSIYNLVNFNTPANSFKSQNKI